MTPPRSSVPIEELLPLAEAAAGALAPRLDPGAPPVVTALEPVDSLAGLVPPSGTVVARLPFQVGTLPGELLVEKFTEMYGLSLSVLRRLTNAASIEFAGTYLPKYLEQQKVWVDTHSPGPLDVRMFDQQVIEPAIRVSHSGIGAAIQDHRSIIRQALYVDHDLSIRFGDVAS